MSGSSTSDAGGAPRVEAAGEAGEAAAADAQNAAAATLDDGTFAERPELFVGAAFLGGVVLAQVLRAVRR